MRDDTKNGCVAYMYLVSLPGSCVCVSTHCSFPRRGVSYIVFSRPFPFFYQGGAGGGLVLSLSWIYGLKKILCLGVFVGLVYFTDVLTFLVLLPEKREGILTVSEL